MRVSIGALRRLWTAERVTLALIALVALGLRLHTIDAYPAPLVDDAAAYDAIARNIVAGNPYSRDSASPYAPEYQRPFGYPAFVAAIYRIFGPEPRAVLVVQVFLGVALIPLVWAITRRLGANRGIAGVASTLVAVDPMLLDLTRQLMRETVTATLLAIAILLVLRAWVEPRGTRWALAGLALAVSSLVRPEAVAYAPAIVVAFAYAAYRRPSVSRETALAAIFTVGLVVLALAPWLAYYHDRFDRWALNRDVQIGLVQRAATIYRDADSSTTLGRTWRRYGLDPRNTDMSEVAFTTLNRLRDERDLDFVTAADTMGRWAGSFFREHPIRWMVQSGWEAVNFSMGYAELTPLVGRQRQERFVRSGYGGLIAGGDWVTSSIFVFTRFGVGLLVLVGTVAAAIAWIARRSPGIVLPAILLVIIVPTSLFGLYAPRVRAPLDPFLIIAATIGWSIIADRLPGLVRLGNKDTNSTRVS